MQLTAKGTWPGELTFRQGWSKAVARPWNETIADAQLRSIRGTTGFIQECVTHLHALGVEGVTSPPLPDGVGMMWRSSGFTPYLSLDLFTRDLTKPSTAPTHIINRGDEDLWKQAVSLDSAAFDELCHLGPLGLKEARFATPSSEFLTVTTSERRLAGFAIVGAGSAVAYLQRVAVLPKLRGYGYGRSLVQACMTWGRSRGSRTMMLNTQPDNHTATQLYESEGFELMGGGLSVLRHTDRET